MIDFETFGNGKHSVICQVGACYFDRATGEIGQTFKVNVDARSSAREGAQFDANTIYWWLSQSKEAIASVIAEPQKHIRVAMAELNEFLRDADNIWSHATFDFVILTETLKLLEMKPLFSFRATRDIRTLLEISKFDYKSLVREGTHHDGLDDAIFQAKYVSMALQKIAQMQERKA